METRTDELYHYGRKGMKWGQNIFGKRKSPGTKRTDSSSSKSATSKKKKTGSFASRVESGRRALSKAMQKRKKEAAKKAELKAKQKTEKEEAKKQKDLETQKKEVLATRSAKTIYENAHLFTDQELQAAYTRLQLERNINSLAPREVNKGREFLDNLNKWGQTVNNLADTGIKIYDNVAKINNAFGTGEKWPLINKGDDKNKGKKIVIEKSDDKPKSTKPKNDSKKSDDSKDNDSKKDGDSSSSKTSKMPRWEDLYPGTDEPGTWPKDKMPRGDDNASSKKSEPEVEKVSGTVEGKGTSHYKKPENIIIDFEETSPNSFKPAVISKGSSYVSNLLENNSNILLLEDKSGR